MDSGCFAQWCMFLVFNASIMKYRYALHSRGVANCLHERDKCTETTLITVLF